MFHSLKLNPPNWVQKLNTTISYEAMEYPYTLQPHNRISWIINFHWFFALLPQYYYLWKINLSHLSIFFADSIFAPAFVCSFNILFYVCFRTQKFVNIVAINLRHLQLTASMWNYAWWRSSQSFVKKESRKNALILLSQLFFQQYNFFDLFRSVSFGVAKLFHEVRMLLFGNSEVSVTIRGFECKN